MYSSASLRKTVQNWYPGNIRVMAIVGRVLSVNYKIGNLLQQIKFLHRLKNSNLLPKHLETLRLPGLFIPKPGTNITGPLEDLHPTAAVLFTKQQQKWENRVQDFLRFTLKMEISEKYSLLELQKSNLHRDSQALAEIVTNKQLNLIMATGAKHKSSACYSARTTHDRKFAAAKSRQTPAPKEAPPVSSVTTNWVNASSSDQPLQEPCKVLLARGPGFMLSPHISRRALAETATLGLERTVCAVRYARRPTLQYHTAGTASSSNNAPTSLKRAASSFEHLNIQPPKTADSETEKQITTLRQELQPILAPTPKSHVWKWKNNHQKSEISSYTDTVRNNKNLTILPTDKTNRLCVLDTALVDEKLSDHMTGGWEELPSDPSKLYQDQANKILLACLNESQITDPHVISRLSSRYTSAPCLFPLAKDHKSSFPNTKLRVVQPVSGSAVEKLDVIVSRVLIQVLPSLQYRVNSADDFILQHIGPLQSTLPPNIHQASLDMEQMYPSLPTNDKAMNIVQDYLSRDTTIDLLGFRPEHIVRMLDFVVNHTYAQTGGSFYRQTSGVGTGYHSSGALAEILVDWTYTEALLLTKIEEQPLSLATYVDDSHSIWANKLHCDNFIVKLSSIWPGIQFTREEASTGPHGEQQLSFLDLLVRTTNNDDGLSSTLEFELYQKDTHSGRYLHFSSHCEAIIKLNLIRTEARRILNRCSSKKLAFPHLERLRSNLIMSGYPNGRVSVTIAEELGKGNSNTPAPTAPSVPHPPTDTECFILKTPYTNEGALRKIRKAIRTSGLPIKLVTTSGTTVGSMVKRSFIASKTTNNCTCKLHQHNVPCDISHVVYSATCKSCDKQYIGATARPLKHRIQEHESAVRLGQVEKSALGEHSTLHHIELGPGETKRSRGVRDFDKLFELYDIKVLTHNRDALATFLSESLQISLNKPDLNRMKENGFIF